jgi:hypothetical protein
MRPLWAKYLSSRLTGLNVSAAAGATAGGAEALPQGADEIDETDEADETVGWDMLFPGGV